MLELLTRKDTIAKNVKNNIILSSMLELLTSKDTIAKNLKST